MITAIVSLAAEALKLTNTIETNLNRPDMIADATKRYRQKHRDAVDAAQTVLANPSAPQTDKEAAFEFIRRVES